MKIRTTALALCLAPIALFGCSSDADNGSPPPDTVAQPTESSITPTAAATAQSAGVRLVSVNAAAALAAEPSISVLDVRTAAEFAQGHIANATELDFYAADFRDQLDKLDRNGHYLIYCHSGNRSGQARAMMAELGFTDVADLDGGITAWTAAGQPITQ